MLVFILCGMGATAVAQSNFLDNYIGAPVTVTTVATTAQQIAQPTDLDFKPNSNELWVCNYGNSSGGSVVILYDAGKPGQSHLYRKDSHSGHFMIYPSAIAFSEVGEWANTNEIKNTASPSSTFMGPALWSGDTAIFARVFQNNWVTGYPLGSHLDMLHQSPFSMGIAHDSAKAYWVMDGYNGNICKYDYVENHGPGYDNHSMGKIWRYTDVPVTRVPGVSSHMVLDKSSGWLYYIDGTSKQIRRMNTNTGTVTGNLFPPTTGSEPLAGYYQVEFAVTEVLDTLASQPSGMDFYNDRLVVSDYTNGNIYLYSTTPSFTLLATITTNLAGMMGVKVGPDGRIWCVNKTQSKVYRLDIAGPVSDLAVTGIQSPEVINHTPNYFSTGFNDCDGTIAPEITISNEGTAAITSADIKYSIDGGTPVSYNWNGSLAAGATQTVTLPVMNNIPNGAHLLRVNINTVNGSSDDVEQNNSFDGSFRVTAPAASLPLTEGFDATFFPPTDWNYVHFNPNNRMERLPLGGFGQSTGSVRMMHFIGPMNTSGQLDHLILPVVDMSGGNANTYLRFSVAYAQRDVTSFDALQVHVSSDCGSTWSMVYNKSGATLSTAPSTVGFFSPAATQWRSDSVSLSSLAGQPEVLVRFTTISDWGNNMYLDDIFIGDVTATGIAGADQPAVSVFPNPATDLLHIVSKGGRQANLLLSDMAGRQVILQEAVSGSAIMDLRNLPQGVYVLQVQTEAWTVSRKVIKR